MQARPIENSPSKSAGPSLSTPADVTLIFAISLTLLIPCFWQTHLQAGDLSSHVYNAWLAAQIKSGAVHGLAIAYQWTNVLCDWALEALLPHLGPDLSGTVVASVAVLIFFWGEFSLISVVSKERPWLWAPTLGMIAYGIVFQLGFLNFYVSTGLSLWILALLWRPTKRKALIAAPLAVFAVLAHAAPLAWAVAILIYEHIARRLSSVQRKFLLLLGAGVLFFVRLFVTRNYVTAPLDQLVSLPAISGLMGLEQVWLYDQKYLIIAGALFFIWGTLLLERIDQGGFTNDTLVHLWLLQIAAFVLLPRAIQLPQYQFAFTFIQQRLSLFCALIFCLVLANSRYGRAITRFTALIATLYFTFLYLDQRALNQAEDEIAELVQTLPPGQRVAASISDSNSRLNPLGHTLDRQCIGHCFSYGDYEPPTGQFRIRVLGTNPVEAPNMDVVLEIEEGRHVVTQKEAPLYSVCPSEDPSKLFSIRPLSAGERTCAFSVPVTKKLW